MDPLSVAVVAASQFFNHNIPPHWFWSLDVWRLLSNEGWLISGTRTTIVLDEWLTKETDLVRP